MPASTSGSTYRGRFAPSPTGPLHFGSLLTAVASYADARAAGGTWLVRMEDLDRPREAPGAARAILEALERFGMQRDESILYQRERTEAYAAALTRLLQAGLAYPCGCTRADIAASGRQGPEGPVYAGTCRAGIATGRRARSMRVRVPSEPIRVPDRIQGDGVQSLAADVGDFVVRRADGIHAYQLAVVVDDAAQGITHIVRGADLLQSTPRQVYLQRSLGLPTPQYAHVPLALDAEGRKLSKSLASAPVDPRDPLPALLHAWRFLGQAAPARRPGSVASFWAHAVSSWRIDRVPRRPSLPAETRFRPAGAGRSSHITFIESV